MSVLLCVRHLAFVTPVGDFAIRLLQAKIRVMVRVGSATPSGSQLKKIKVNLDYNNSTRDGLVYARHEKIREQKIYGHT